MTDCADRDVRLEEPNVKGPAFTSSQLERAQLPQESGVVRDGFGVGSRDGGPPFEF